MSFLGLFLESCASPACSPVPFPLQRGAHLLPVRGALRSHIIMHIRYKQSCLIILRHISDRVINKHCKINEEKCDLQFPLIGKALAIARHKVIVLGLRTGEGSGTRAAVLSVPSSHTQLHRGQGSWVVSPLASSSSSQELSWECRSRASGRSPSALGTGSLIQAPSAHYGFGSQDFGCLWDPCWSPPCLMLPALQSLLFLCHI